MGIMQTKQGNRGRRLGFEVLEDRRFLSGVLAAAESSAVVPQEQLFVYLLNRARHDPYAYQVEQGLSVDLSSVTPRPPLAVNDKLFGSAGFHAQEMAQYNYFDHQSLVTGDWPNKMARDQGYPLPASWPSDKNYIESIAAGTFYDNAATVLRELIVDTDVPSLGHRNHLLGIDTFNAGNREIGVGYGRNDAAHYRHYWAIHITRASTADTFLTGVVYNDANGNGRYDLGEGLSGVEVRAGTLSTVTNMAGGWSIQVTPGIYEVAAYGGALARATTSVYVGGDNVEVDFVVGQSRGIVNFGANMPPVARDDSYAVSRDGQLNVAATGVLGNDSDVNANPLTATLVSNVTRGTLTLRANGSFDYVPRTGFVGFDSFTYRANDGAGDSNLATVTVAVAAPLESVDYRQLASQATTGGALAYRLAAVRDGMLTAEVTAGSGTSTATTLYALDGNGALQELVRGTTRADYDRAVAGQDFFLKVTGLGTTATVVLANLVQTSAGGAQMTVFGTAGDDVLEASFAASTRTVVIKGVRYASSLVSSLSFTGSGGTDTATLTGAAGSDAATFRPRSLSMTGAGYQAQVNDVATITVYGGGGNDMANFIDSAGNDEFVGAPTYAGLSGAGFLNRAWNFSAVRAEATAGGVDVAKLYDSPGDETLVVTPSYAALLGSAFSHQVWYFEGAHAYASAGGVDVAKFYDSPRDDTFYADPQQAALYRVGEYYSRAKYFDATHAFATAGGHDVARLYDSTGNDTFYADPTQAALYGRGFYNRVKYFDEVYASGAAGGRDEAYLYDSASIDRLDAQDNWARLSNATLDFLYQVSAFDYVKATATTAGDTKAVAPQATLSFQLVLVGPWQ